MWGKWQWLFLLWERQVMLLPSAVTRTPTSSHLEYCIVVGWKSYSGIFCYSWRKCLYFDVWSLKLFLPQALTSLFKDVKKWSVSKCLTHQHWYNDFKGLVHSNCKKAYFNTLVQPGNKFKYCVPMPMKVLYEQKYVSLDLNFITLHSVSCLLEFTSKLIHSL